MKVNVCGIDIDKITLNETVALIDGFIRERKPVSVVTPNVDHVVRFNRDGEFKKIYDKADLVLADGVPIIWASKLLGNGLPEKISGSDLFPHLCGHAAEMNHSVFLLGGRPGAADKAAEKLLETYPDLKIAGTYCPPLRFEEDREECDKILNMVKAAAPDILFVGLGSPKQENWINENKDKVNVPVSLGIGVSFEFIAGMVKRAPVWMQRTGFEWLWRLMMEPKRLWKRYILDDSYFAILLIKQLAGRNK